MPPYNFDRSVKADMRRTSIRNIRLMDQADGGGLINGLPVALPLE